MSNNFMKGMAKERAKQISEKYGFPVFIDVDRLGCGSQYFKPEITIGNVEYIGQGDWAKDARPYAVQPAGQISEFMGHNLDEISNIYARGDLGELEALYDQLTDVLTKLMEFPTHGE